MCRERLWVIWFRVPRTVPLQETALIPDMLCFHPGKQSKQPSLQSAVTLHRVAALRLRRPPEISTYSYSALSISCSPIECMGSTKGNEKAKIRNPSLTQTFVAFVSFCLLALTQIRADLIALVRLSPLKALRLSPLQFHGASRARARGARIRRANTPETGQLASTHSSAR